MTEIFTRKTAPSGSKENRTWWVYTLADSRSPTKPRYVGITYRPKARLSAHVNLAGNGCSTHKSCWIRSVLDAGGDVVLMVLADGLTIDEAKKVEIREIALLKSLGHDLTNGTAGGDGVTDLVPEIRARISAVWIGRKHTAESRAKMSASTKGQVQSRESIDRRTEKNRGQKRPPEFSAKMSLIRSGKTGQVHSAETRAKMSASRTGMKRKPRNQDGYPSFREISQ